MTTATVSPPDSATLLYHAAVSAADEAVANYRAAAYSKVEADLLADRHRATLANIKAGWAKQAAGKNEAERAADLTQLLDLDPQWQRFTKDLEGCERRSKELAVEIAAAQMAHSIAKRQLDFAAAMMRVLS